MSGVEILSATEVVTDCVYNYWLAGFAWIGSIILVGIIGYFVADYLNKFEGALIGCCVGALLGLFVYAGFAVGTSTPIATEMQYKVIISDEVSMNEFLDKYEIIDQEGKIYIVVERTDD